jgi:hypothetical protein
MTSLRPGMVSARRCLLDLRSVHLRRNPAAQGPLPSAGGRNFAAKRGILCMWAWGGGGRAIPQANDLGARVYECCPTHAVPPTGLLGYEHFQHGGNWRF